MTGNHASAGNGGGIASDGGTVTLADSTVDGNHAEGGNGGGIWNQSGTTNLVNATISRNTATGNGATTGNGGGIFNDTGTVSSANGFATNLTIAGNTADGAGGGVYTTGGVSSFGSATIAGNTADGAGGGGVYNDDASFAFTLLQNTLLARNGTNCAGMKILSGGNNLDTGTTCFPVPGPGDQTPATDPGLSDTNVGLGPLAANGGPTQGSTEFPKPPKTMETMALMPTSPAVDTAGATCPPFATDQRGVPRPQEGNQGTTACDIGAYELAPCITVDKTCAVILPTGSFTCKTPITALQMQWAPGSMTDASRWVLTQPGQVIDIKAWNGKVGDKGATVVSTQCGLQPGDTVTVAGLGKNPDVFWQVYASNGTCVPDTPTSITGTLLGQSKFHVGGLSCDDTDMNGSEDCGKFEGDGKDNKTGFINDWVFEGMTSSSSTNNTLVCNAQPGKAEQNCVVPVGGGDVRYTYTVKNIGRTPVTGTLTDMVGTTTVASDTFTNLLPGSSQSFDSTDTITQTTTNTATAVGDNGLPIICTASDSVTVHVACVIGYPYADPGGNTKTSIAFNESGVLRAFQPDFAGPGDTIRVFYNDEHALTLGVRQVVVKGGATPGTKNFSLATPPTTAPLSAGCLPPSCGATNPPAVGSTAVTGDFAALDGSGRPMFPALFITDVTNDPDSTAGDWQFGGTAIPPHFVSGTRKGAVKTVDKTKSPAVTTTITPDADPTKNNFTLGPGSDTAPPGLVNEGYGAEVRWNVNDLHINPITGTGSTNPADPLLSDDMFKGHTFRMQFMVHDGDQNKTGGDVGQNCTMVSMPQSQ